ncbi:MAG: Thymidylate kinase [Candidatus Moranbacteria bacterium GW2011_GWE2_47_10]|nr:MAG: Thymidylate kinase [Candidatus Moranbacteria bacterium GW2011_GWE2_47_10]
MKKGKFIVIDGTDGSGKATQTELLVKRLKKAGHKVKVFDFPQYGLKWKRAGSRTISGLNLLCLRPVRCEF